MLSMASEEWVNTIVASYIEPTQKWAEHGAPVRRETADIVADGKPREQRMMLGFVTWVKQAGRVAEVARSEEHTSELQSLMRSSYAVFCLKTKTTTHNNTHTNRNQQA